MSWKLRYSKQAAKDAERLSRAGLGDSAVKLLGIIAKNPFQNPPGYEKLGGDLKGKYSRRISKQHRLVYEVLKKERIINVLRMWSHYE